jgi:uncharacterized protein involved in type VI secretion and phage assembly
MVNGVTIGIVISLDDPENLGRVKVHLPYYSDSNESNWAPIATLMAGAKRGSWFMPELHDEVLVAFDQGNTEHPYIVGSLWNGKDKPPNSDIDVKVRRIQTTSGHIIEFDDRPGKEAIHIHTQGGHKFQMNDATPAKITITTKGGQTIEMDDLPAKITIQTSAGNQVSLSDVPPGIKVSSAGTLNIDCLQATVNAAQLTVNAAITTFTGTVLASSFVGGAYTPAPGNTFGL